MRYKTPIPLSYAQEHYLQLSDSDDEGNVDKDGHSSFKRHKQRSNKIIVGGGTVNGTSKIKKGNGAAVPIKILFKREASVNRERPVSGAMFRSIAEIDPELKVSSDRSKSPISHPIFYSAFSQR